MFDWVIGPEARTLQLSEETMADGMVLGLQQSNVQLVFLVR